MVHETEGARLALIITTDLNLCSHEAFPLHTLLLPLCSWACSVLGRHLQQYAFFTFPLLSYQLSFAPQEAQTGPEHVDVST